MTLSAQHLPILSHQMFQECILSCTAVAIGLTKQREEKTPFIMMQLGGRIGFYLLLFLLKHHVFHVTNKAVIWF